MNFDPNGLFFKMCEIYQENKTPGNKIIICNEGGSRSSKTWDFYHFLVAFLDHNRNKNLDCYLLRDTLANCRDYTMHEFVKCLEKIGIDVSSLITSPKPYFKLFGNNIYFRGLDGKSEEYPSDILFFNEALETEKQKVMGLIMRNRLLTVMDWNPKYTAHWCFDLEKRPDCFFTRSTYKNNKHLEQSIIKEIEGYEPTPVNIANGTADIYRWKVYGLGERANKEGLVFRDVTYIDVFPDDCDELAFGMDFGETNATAIVKLGLKKIDSRRELYLQKLFYYPTDNVNIIIEALKKLQLPKHIWADNNKPGWISDLRQAGFSVLTTAKFPGSRDYWITSLLKHKLFIVRDIDFQKEQENFCYRVVDGIQLSETEKKYDHLWSAAGYGCVGDFRY